MPDITCLQLRVHRPLSLSNVLIITLLLVVVGSANAQSAVDGSTASGLAPGSPAGSYALSDLDSINPYNGVLNFRVPLVNIGGRGRAQMTMAASIQPESWVVRQSRDGHSFVDRDWWTNLKPGYGPGILQGRPVGTESNQTCDKTGQLFYFETLTRLTFTTADGTEFELRDKLTGGEPAGAPVPCSEGTSRGTDFVTSDGSAALFESDSVIRDNVDKLGPRLIFPSGHLMLRDGTRYRIDNGTVTWMRDSNGNLLHFFYDGNKRVRLVRDSLNREVTVTYANLETTFNDVISFKGFMGAPRVVKVFYKRLSQILRTDSYPPPVKSQFDLFPLTGSNNTLYNPFLISSIELPDRRSYQFRYNYYGELARAVLPTNAVIEYDTAPGPGIVSHGSGGFFAIYRRIRERRIYPNGGSGANFEGRLTYSAGSDPTVMDHFDVNNNLLLREKHYYHGNPEASFFRGSLDYAGWKEGKEYKTEIMDHTGEAVIERVERTWRQRAPISWWQGIADKEPANDPRLVETRTTLVETNQVSIRSSINPQTGAVSYDQFNNQTDVWEYDFGINGSPGPLLRHIQSQFLTTNPITGGNYLSDVVHILSLPVRVSVFDAGGIERCRSTFEYDNYSSGMTNRLNITSHESQRFDTGFTHRGNLTKSTQWLLPDIPISTSTTYDIAGNPVTRTDANGKTSHFEFADRFGQPDGNARANDQRPVELGEAFTYAFVTKGTNAVNQSAFAQYDYYLGQPVDTENINGVASSNFFNDDLDRVTKTLSAVGTELESQTLLSYDDDARTVTTHSDLNAANDQLLMSAEIFDGLGRTIEIRRQTPQGNTRRITTYDGMGRIKRVTNPHRSVAEETYGWTDFSYDPRSLSTRIEKFDGQGTSTGTLLTTYSGNSITRRDAANKQKRTTTDALGRLTKLETLLEHSTSVYSTTTYTYDVKDNLTRVTQQDQATQTRTFAYDSLSRLTETRNPESGTTTFNLYDNNGNLLRKTDSRGIVTQYAFDDLNRLTSRIYANDPTGTPPVTYIYDDPSVPFSKGRVTRVSSTASITEFQEYDALGRLKRNQQTTDGSSYPIRYGYDLAGNQLTETYPSGRVVTSSYDTAGRLSQLSGQKPGEEVRSYLTNIEYSAHGGPASMSMGNNLVQTTRFNSRLQPIEIKLIQGAATQFSLQYDYGSSANNGNVLSQTITTPGVTFIQSYTYDTLNRISVAQENNGASWKQSFLYDRFGNRRIDTANTTPNVAGPNPAIDQATNQYSAGQGYDYDEAGNLIQEPGNGYTYDAENRLVRLNGNAATYLYDGDGRRVKKTVGTATTIYVYNASGQLLAEYGSQATQRGTTYLTLDPLGSTRVTTNASGTVQDRHDYLPFGEEIGPNVGSRNPTFGYTFTDPTRQRFTGKERDPEAGLDFFGARYYASTHGRFTTVDPLLTSGTVHDSQTWNRYSYAINNPLKWTDPDGLFIWSDSLGGNVTDDELRRRAGTDKKALREANRIIDKRNQFRRARAAAERASTNLPAGADQNLLNGSLTSYGDERTVNGVTVGEGRLANGIAAQATVTGFTYDDTTGNLRADVSVVLSDRDQGNLTIDVAHEGRHVADAQEFAAALVADRANGGTTAVAGASNRTRYEREFRGYTVSSITAQGLGLDNLSVGNREIWNRAWAPADRAVTERTAAINHHLRESPVYGLTPANPGERYMRR